jgi:hypothetical protein
MGRYLVLWEIDHARIPVDAKERKGALTLMFEMTKNDIKSGRTKDHGLFVGEINGYSVLEGTEVEVTTALAQYTPYVLFNVHAIASADHMGEILKKM